MMRSHILITVASIAVVSIVVAFVLTLALPQHSQGMLSPPAGEPAILDGEEAPYQYLLGEYQGRLAVFLPNRTEPEEVFSVYLSTLPPYDRGQLQLGIPIMDYQQLVERIEDYIS